MVPYPEIRQHGVIGDRRTAALVAADGTLDWLCLPDYDGTVVFGALLDHARGGFWQLGPAEARLGSQRYREGTSSLVTRWALPAGELELTDVMVWPGDERPAAAEHQRVVVRRLRCTRGSVRCESRFRPGADFGELPLPLVAAPGGVDLTIAGVPASLWTCPPLPAAPAAADFVMTAGDEGWAVLAYGARSGDWTPARAARALAEANAEWTRWTAALDCGGPRARRVREAALLAHLLGYAPRGSLVAAPTTSLPERIGGDWNADYRLAWIRDASLSVEMLARLGQVGDAQRYLDFVAGLGPEAGAPLQVLYGIRGEREPGQQERWDLHGYRGSKPVRFGNHAYLQRQLGSLQYLVDCVLAYLEHGGAWRGDYWDLVRRAADYTAARWGDLDNSLWELAVPQHYVATKVLCWSTLRRAAEVAERVAPGFDTARWRATAAAIHEEVMRHGWSERLGAFRQRYEAENLDAAALLIPLTGFLPVDHPRVRATVQRIEQELTIDGFVYRFVPAETPGPPPLPLGEMEAAFLPCTFWLATVHARSGRPERAEAILDAVEAIAGDLGLFAEAVDPRDRTFRGNTPLLFSHVEYVRAVRAIDRARARRR